MKNILAAPLRGSAPSVGGQDAGLYGAYACWRLVERRLLSPARRDALECLLRLERADKIGEPWRAGDMAQLCGSFDAEDIELVPFAASLPVSRHGAVGLLPGGWPADDWVRSRRASLCLPIASGAHSATLDLLVFSGHDASPSLDREMRARLLVDTSFDLRIMRSPGYPITDGAFLFIGDFASAALARAFAQEQRSEELVFLIESGRGDASLWPQAILQHECWRDSVVRATPMLGQMSDLAPMLDRHDRKIRSLIENDAPMIVAGASESFISFICAGLRSFLGDDVVACITNADRLRKIKI